MLTRDFTDMIVTRATGKKLSQEILDLTKNTTDLQNRAVNVKYPPVPLTAAVSDANYYNPTDKLWYVDSGFTQLATDNSSVFTALDALNVPIFCPPGNYYAPTASLIGRYFGKGAMIICTENTTFNAAQPTSIQTTIRNFVLGTVPQPILNEFYGKNAGASVQYDAYANTAIGENALTSLTTAKRNTAVGYQALKSNTTQYSNVAVGADALSTGRFFQRSVAVGDNAMKWTGILDPIATRHELWVNEFDQYNVWTDPTSDYYRWLQKNPGGQAAIAAILQPTGYSAPVGATILNPGGGFPAPVQSEDCTRNVALGRDSLVHLVNGSYNTALGYQALANAYTANQNTGIGAYALNDNLAGTSNVAIGYNAAMYNQTGNNNTIVGEGAMNDNITGSSNVVLGSLAGAGFTGNNSVIIGYKAHHPSITRDRQLIIDYGNDVNNLPFIYGEFDTGFIQFRATQLRLGGDGGVNGGVKINVGTGVPTVGYANGSLFIRTDGGTGSTLYVRENGVWVAK